MSKAKRAPRTPKDRYRDWLALQGSFGKRIASYLKEVGELTKAGSAEPRSWIENYAKLWSGFIGDVGDWIKRESSITLRPTEEWVSRCRLELRKRNGNVIPIEVPIEAFQNENGTLRSEITLVTGGLSRAGHVKGVSLDPGEHVRFKNPTVNRAERYAELNLFDLPALRPGEMFGGLVWAKETKRPVATLEVLVFEA